LAAAEQQLFREQRQNLRFVQVERVMDLWDMAGVILVLTLTNFSYAEAYRKNEESNTEYLSIFRLDTAITFITVMVFLFLLVLIGDYLQRRMRSAYLPSKENAALSILYVPCLLFLIVLMILQIISTWLSVSLSGKGNFAFFLAILLIFFKSIMLIVKFYKAEVKESVVAFFGKPKTGLGIAIWSFTILIWVPTVLILFYPWILLWYALKNIFFICTCGGNSALDPEDRKCGKCCATTIHVLKARISRTLREAKIRYGYFLGFGCCTEVDLHSKYELFCYET
jgi:hypothetical protein